MTATVLLLACGGRLSGSAGDEPVSSASDSSSPTPSHVSPQDGDASSGSSTSYMESGVPDATRVLPDFALSTEDAQIGSDLAWSSRPTLVTVTPLRGYVGTLFLVATGAPAAVECMFDAPMLEITSAVPQSANLTCTVGAAAVPGTYSLSLMAGDGNVVRATSLSLVVYAQLTIFIPPNIDALRSATVGFTDAFGPEFGANPTPLTAPTGSAIWLKVINLDSVPHVLHGEGRGITVLGTTSTATLPHGNTEAPLTTEAEDTTLRTLAPGQTYLGSLHDGTDNGSLYFQIVVNP